MVRADTVLALAALALGGCTGAIGDAASDAPGQPPGDGKTESSRPPDHPIDRPTDFAGGACQGIDVVALEPTRLRLLSPLE
jgi:hypothetical protein